MKYSYTFEKFDSMIGMLSTSILPLDSRLITAYRGSLTRLRTEDFPVSLQPRWDAFSGEMLMMCQIWGDDGDSPLPDGKAKELINEVLSIHHYLIFQD